MTRPRSATTEAPGAAVLMVLFGLLTALLLGGCARVMDRGAQDYSPEPPSVEETAPAEREVAVEPDAPVGATSALVDEAVLHFSEERYQIAASLLTRFLEGTNGAEANEQERARAIWGLAMLHLTPASPTHDPTLGKSFLHRLEEEFPGTTWSMQARWAQGLVGEMERVQSEAAAQEALLRQLTETVEQLRRIDLNRRPTGGAADTTRSGGRDLQR